MQVETFRDTGNHSDPAPCDACERLREVQTEWLYEPVPADRRAELRHLMRPKTHDWGPGCELGKIARSDDNLFTESQLREADNTVSVEMDGGVLHASLNIEPEVLMDHIEVSVQIGDEE